MRSERCILVTGVGREVARSAKPLTVHTAIPVGANCGAVDRVGHAPLARPDCAQIMGREHLQWGPLCGALAPPSEGVYSGDAVVVSVLFGYTPRHRCVSGRRFLTL